MAERETLTIDALEEANIAVESTSQSVEIKNEKLSLFIEKVVTKSKSVFLAILGLVIFGGVWELVSSLTEGALPTPIATLTVLYEMLSDPFYDYGPNDKGIGLQLINSIKTVLLGFF
ncbi:hypothetical protein [Flavobacterium nitratireducens]|uniref:hypothetical protein n=1 Tax=Flavobacterium nitratireducens TaxID=992289 RepID=UPI0024155263|nr:hypothetical protein [Flavobacterium nitratireducens]